MTIMIAAAALLAAAPPQAADPQWVYLLELPDGAMTWYDPASVVRGEGGIRVRMRARPGPSSATGALEFNSVEEFDCVRRMARTISLVADMENGESITVPMDEEEAEAINPDSPLAALHAIVCPPSPGV
jgi:hypothetical protein